MNSNREARRRLSNFLDACWFKYRIPVLAHLADRVAGNKLRPRYVKPPEPWGIRWDDFLSLVNQDSEETEE